MDAMKFAEYISSHRCVIYGSEKTIRCLRDQSAGVELPTLVVDDKVDDGILVAVDVDDLFIGSQTPSKEMRFEI